MKFGMLPKATQRSIVDALSTPLPRSQVAPMRGLSPRPHAYGAHALPAELRRLLVWVDGYIVSPLGIRCCDKQRRPHAASPTPHLTQAAPCSVPASACQRAADAATVALEAEAAVAEAAGAAAAAAAAMANEAEHAGGWWGHWHAYAGCSPAKSTSLAQPMGTQRGQSPLRGLSPRPYAYEAHALPAELRRLDGRERS